MPDTKFARPARVAISGLTVERRDAGPLAGRILDRVDLVLEPGDVAAVTGPSGAGKTTLLHAMAGLLAPDHGSVCWGDVDIGAMPESWRDRWRRDAVGLVFQDFQLLPELGVIDNILLPVSFDHWRAPRVLRERASALAQRVGLADMGAPAAALSRGEQQRVALARALIRRPALLLADEPTASLDPDNAALVTDMLIDMAHETAATLLVVSHDRATLGRTRRVFRLEAGRLTGPGRTP